MKKILLIAFFFLTGLLNLVSVEFNYSTGIKYNSPSINISSVFADSKYAYGINLNLNNFPFTISAGNLSCSGSYSKLKAPVISSNISPFSVPSFMNKLNASLPDASSLSKPFSIYCAYNFKDKKLILNEFSASLFFIPEDLRFYCSVFSNFHPNTKLSFSTSIISSFYQIDNLNQNVWFSEVPLFKGSGTSSRFNFNLIYYPVNSSIISLTNNTAINLYDNTSSEIKFTLNNTTNLKTKRMNFYNDFYYNGFSQIFTDKDKSIESLLQIKSGFNYNTLKITETGPLIFSTGLCSFISWNYNSQELLLKQALGEKITSPALFISANLCCSETHNETKFYLENINTNFKISGNINDFSPYSTFSFSYSPDKDFVNFSTTEKFAIGFNYNGLVNINTSSTISLTQKNFNLEKINLNASISTNFRLKKISCTGKISAAFNLEDF